MLNLFSHSDPLAALNKKLSLSDKLDYLRKTLLDHFPFIDRIAVAIYDPDTDMLKTLAYSSSDASPLVHYQSKLHEANSLLEILHKKRPRVVNDLSLFAEGKHDYTQRLAEHGYGSSYTHPILYEDQFYGFVFYNSLRTEVFEERVLVELDICSHLIMLLVVTELAHLRTLAATVRSALSITHQRDPETGDHIARMSHYSRIIAVELADRLGFDDQFIENIFLFSPLHDVGKIGIPDQILLKPGSLSEEEFEVMKTHAIKGREIIDDLLENFNLSQFQNIEMIQNIAQYHHEAVDGTGYPCGLASDDIPIEARIVAVADVFDALTSQRPYKKAWNNDDAFDLLRKLAGIKLDQQCVEALVKNRENVEQIQQLFKQE
ncbi:MAG: HD-GYP domain-containing protein [Gammaproteobacteria bacterium]